MYVRVRRGSRNFRRRQRRPAFDKMKALEGEKVGSRPMYSKEEVDGNHETKLPTGAPENGKWEGKTEAGDRRPETRDWPVNCEDVRKRRRTFLRRQPKDLPPPAFLQPPTKSIDALRAPPTLGGGKGASEKDISATSLMGRCLIRTAGYSGPRTTFFVIEIDLALHKFH